MPDMIIPFIMLLIITIALFLERKHHEDKIVDIYEEKFENWKKHSSHSEQKQPKELVGLVFLEDYKLTIEVLDKRAIDPLQRKKYNIKEKL